MFRIRILLVFTIVFSVLSCNSGDKKEASFDECDIIQEQDEHISLSLKDAYLHYDENNPDRNTAEWGFTVNWTGRYEVWLSSLTKDTMNLRYSEPVIVHFGDKRLESQPIGNEIVLDDSKVLKPYFRAESRLGSILIEDSGHYNIQIISEKVLPAPQDSDRESANTILDRIILKPQGY